MTCSVLIACSGGNSSNSDNSNTSSLQTAENHISGNAVKGVISNGLVSAYLLDTGTVNTPNTNRQLLGQSRTDSTGRYNISLPELNDDSIVLLELTADSQTSMRCDVIDGCLYTDNNISWNILLAEFGAELPLPSHFKLIGIKQGSLQTQAFISPLSHIVYVTASSLPGGLSNSNITTASSWVAQTFNLKTDVLTTETPDLTSLASLENLNSQQLKQGILSAAFYSLTMSEVWSKGEIDLGTLPLEEIFRDMAYSASTLSEQLNEEQTTYSEALSVITSEAQDQPQTPPSVREDKSLKIIQQPKSLRINQNNNFSLSVLAKGNGELSYQWKKNNQDIPGANLAHYSVTNATLSDAGSYSVSVIDNNNSLMSLNALVSVSKPTTPVSIVRQPQTLTITAGDPLTLDVGVAGDGPYEYQWQKGGSILLSQTNSTLNIAESLQTDSGTYRVIVSNGNSEVSSNFVDIIVNGSIQSVTITQHPSNLTITEGETAGFHVNATGGGFITYQWRKDGINLENAYASHFEFNSADIQHSGNYDVVITNSQGSITSNITQLTVLPSEPPVSITLQPISASVLLGDSIDLRTAATGGDALSYQWFLDGEIITGANQAEYYVDRVAPEHQGSYTVRVNNQHSYEESLTAIISIKARPSVQLSWGVPEFREDGQPLEIDEISAYILEYTNSSTSSAEQIIISNANDTQYTLTNLEPGPLYVRIATIDSSDIQGKFSDWITISIE